VEASAGHRLHVTVSGTTDPLRAPERADPSPADPSSVGTAGRVPGAADGTPEGVPGTTTTVTADAAHLTRLLQSAGHPPA
jgi:hypothetical protein